MDRKKHFERHYAKLRFESWFNSFLISAIIGLFAGFASALVTWFLDFDGVVLSIFIAVATCVLLTPVFYFAKYRPDVVKNARRLDRLGLEERLVTMVEYETDESYIAKMQREDAKASLNRLESSRIKLSISKVAMILLIVSGSLFVTMNCMEALGEAGILPGGDALVEAIIPEEQIKYFEVVYDVDGGGYIYGEAEQLVPEGGQTTEIVAVADDGWEFVEWEDGYKKPARYDKNITEDVIFIAVFTQTGDDGNPSDQQDPNGDPNDKPSDRPNQNQENQDSQENQENQENNDNQQTQDESDQPTNKGGSKYQEANQVIDGETYYKDALNSEYLDKLRERLEKEGDTLTEEERYIIESYLGIV